MHSVSDYRLVHAVQRTRLDNSRHRQLVLDLQAQAGNEPSTDNRVAPAGQWSSDRPNRLTLLRLARLGR